MKNIEYLLALHSIDGLGPVRLKAVLEYFKDPKLAWEADIKEMRVIGVPQNTAQFLSDTRKKLDPYKYLEDIKKAQVKWMTIFDENYPKLLAQIYDPPIVLYYKGDILPKDERSVAVVGTRKISGYGKLVTEKLTVELVSLGITIISGLARGVDSQAHRVAIDHGGRTLAVLGGGLKKIFPAENIPLADKIASGFGAVISEFPPNQPSLPGNFPARNRIISGLAQAVLVTEAAEDSGSLITAKCALEQGREVVAVPGSITSDLSKGPALLIKQGAKLVGSAEEILEELGWKAVPQKMTNSRQNDVVLTDREQQILDCITSDNKHIDQICQELNLKSSLVAASLVKMEIIGVVRNLGGGNYTKIW